MMLVRIKKLITSGFVRFIRGDNASIRLQAINKSTTSTQINKSATSTQINKATIATEISLRERFSLNAKLTTINSRNLSDNIISAVMLIILRLQLLLFGLLVAISTVAAAQFSYGNCEVKGSMAKGQCIHIRDCPNLYQIFTLNNQTKEQRQLLADSQCGVDNTRPSVPSVQRILVCCSVEDKPDDKPEPGNVLPRIGECGRMFDNRIIGGTKTQLFEFPWMALLRYKKPNNEYGFNCGGTLINSRYVLTAGHCLNSSKLEKSRWELHSVRLGEWDTSTAPDCVTELTKKTTCAPLHIDIDIEQRILHESYVPNSIDQMHDIALLRLKQLVTFTEYVKPICLPVADDVRNNNFEGYAMDVAGWGVTEDGSPSNTKLKITVDVWNLEQCQAKYRVYQLHLNGSQLCAGGKNQIDTCQGDSGGPLMVPIHVDNHEVFFVAGVTSYGPLPCGLQGWPGVYTRVGNYVDWVKTKLLA